MSVENRVQELGDTVSFGTGLVFVTRISIGTLVWPVPLAPFNPQKILAVSELKVTSLAYQQDSTMIKHMRLHA
jgi:hypothetical protein